MNGGTAVDAGGDVAAGGRPFGRLAIVNRGEPAMRLINAVREWNAEGRPPLRTIALYTAVDRRAMFVREADEAVLIGPDDRRWRGRRQPLPGPRRARARAARLPGRRRVAGLGLRLRARRVRALCRDLGIVFVGPSPEVMRGSATRSSPSCSPSRSGVPMAAWSGGPVPDVAAAREHAEKIGYPLMVKATAGGGGRGIRLRRPGRGAGRGLRARLRRGRAHRGRRHRLPRARAARRAPRRGAGRRRRHGDVWTLGVRDCSVQRRNQKVLEESASTALDAEQERLLRASAAELARAAGYVNAGTVEFLYEPARASAVVHGGQHPAAGGAPGHRGHHRRRHRQAPAARRDGRAAGRDRRRPRRPRTGTRSRPA